jgi:hypothetical protein
MSKLTAALTAAVFATGTLAGTPARADRWNEHHDRGHFANRHVEVSRHEHHDRGDGRWIVGLGLLAGTAMLLAATEPRPAVYAPPVAVYSPPVYSPPPRVVVYRPEPPVYAPPAPAYAVPADRWWYYCRQPAGYFPYVQQCSSGWTRIAPQPPM